MQNDVLIPAVSGRPAVSPLRSIVIENGQAITVYHRAGKFPIGIGRQIVVSGFRAVDVNSLARDAAVVRVQ